MSRWSSNAGGWAKKTRLAEQQRGHRAEPPHRVLPSFQRKIEPARRGRRNLIPECAKSCDAVFGRVSRNDCRVDCADRDAGDPVRLVAMFRQCFINAGLIRAECTAALQNQSDLLVVLGFRYAGRGFPVHKSCPLSTPQDVVSRGKRLTMPWTRAQNAVQELIFCKISWILGFSDKSFPSRATFSGE